MSEQSVKFAVGGAVQTKHGTYIERPADDELFETCQAGEFSYVLACRQIGKSSLMVETAHRLSETGVRTASIDLNTIGQNVAADMWYFSLIEVVTDRLRLTVDVEKWWDSIPTLSTVPARFLRFFRDVVLSEIKEPVVIFVDEIDVTLGLEFTDDFFAAIRTIYTTRVEEPLYQRLTFVLLGVATPDELVKDHTRTPFNIGQAINLLDFTKAECAPFHNEIEATYPNRGGRYFDQIYDWTSGHPYLTQKLCTAVLKAARDDGPDLVDTLVRQLFLAPEARGEDNIQFVQTRVTRDPYAQAMLRVYKRVLEEDEAGVPDDEQSPVINRLKLYGLIENRDGQLTVRNNIYAQAFDRTWTDEMLKNIQLGLPDKYSILRRIGQRGFVSVFLAQTEEDVETAECVALKVIKVPEEAEADWANWMARLEQNAQKVVEIIHPNIVRIFDTGRIDEKTLYIVMEYISGGSLREQLKDGPWTRSKAMEIVRQIGAALICVHEQGICHSAVNPNDILLDTHQESPRLVLTDFGLAKCLLQEPWSQLKRDYRTQTSQFVAPEQRQQGMPGPAADVYGLAVTFFETMAGQLPAGRQEDKPLPPLSRVMPEIGPHFDAILSQATAPEPASRFATVADFIAAIEAANEKAEQVEQSERQMRAATVVDAAQGYMDKRRYDPERALSMIEAALEICPEYLDALLLRGRIWLRQDEIDKALADFEQAYAQVQDPTSVIGLEYLDLLSQVAERCWQQGARQEAVQHYETIHQILADGQVEGDETVSELRQTAWSRLVEYHLQEAEDAYTTLETAEEIDEAMAVLQQKTVVLEALKADSSVEELQQKYTALQVMKYEKIIDQAQVAIEQINADDGQTDANEEAFQHYLTIDEAYQALITLEPDNAQWPTQRHEKLKERAWTRARFATQALQQPEPDYEAALRHFQAIRDIETTDRGVAQALELDLDKTISSLQIKLDHDGKYRTIRQLVGKGEYIKALDRLEQDFIQTSNYEYRDVAKLLWQAVYAKQNDGRLPPELAILSVFGSLNRRWVRQEQAQLQNLKAKLGPWSQTKVLETIDYENKTLGDFEAEIESVEELIAQAVKHGVAERPEVSRCYDELNGLKRQINNQRQKLYQIETHETAQKVDAWLYRIEDIETFLQSDRPAEDIPEFLNRIEAEQQAIEKDPTFQNFQSLVATNAQIGQMIDQVKLRIKRRLVRILIGDVGRRDEEIARLRDELAKAQVEVAGARMKTAKAKLHEIDRYIIPLALIATFVAGGLLAPQLEAALPGLLIIRWIALLLLFVYFGYYVWSYYVSPSSDE